MFEKVPAVEISYDNNENTKAGTHNTTLTVRSIGFGHLLGPQFG